jgi:Sec-independent protein translocase protein TatA
MFGLGIGEIAVIIFLALLIFGPKFFAKRLEGIQESFQGFSKSFKSGQDDVAALPPGSEKKN